jgi:hypothetical protein
MSGTLAFSVAVLVVLYAPSSSAYLKSGFQVGDRTVSLRWQRLPVRYFVTDRAVSGVSPTQLRDAAGRAAVNWQNLPMSSISFEFAGFTGAQPGDGDSLSTLGFRARPDLERVLAQTSFLVNTLTGEIVESDVMFNSTFTWSVAAAGEPGQFDVESIALHEMGHMLGLGHSAIGETEMRPGGHRVIAAEAVMFPIAFSSGNIEGRRLRSDDIAGASDIYPDGDFRSATGSVTGSVIKNGQGVFGAHVVAFNLATGTLVANYTLDTGGNFTIAGLDPGRYVLRVEPLDDGETSSYFSNTSRVDVSFLPKFADRTVVVPGGGTGRPVQIEVQPK